MTMNKKHPHHHHHHHLQQQQNNNNSNNNNNNNNNSCSNNNNNNNNNNDGDERAREQLKSSRPDRGKASYVTALRWLTAVHQCIARLLFFCLPLGAVFPRHSRETRNARQTPTHPPTHPPTSVSLPSPKGAKRICFSEANALAT